MARRKKPRIHARDLAAGRAHVPFALGEPDVTLPLHEILDLGEQHVVAGVHPRGKRQAHQVPGLTLDEERDLVQAVVAGEDGLQRS